MFFGIRDPRSGIRDGKNPDPGSGINIPDPQHCFAVVYRIMELKNGTYLGPSILVHM
jgi:hypothetical protein